MRTPSEANVRSSCYYVPVFVGKWKRSTGKQTAIGVALVIINQISFLLLLLCSPCNYRNFKLDKSTLERTYFLTPNILKNKKIKAIFFSIFALYLLLIRYYLLIKV